MWYVGRQFNRGEALGHIRRVVNDLPVTLNPGMGKERVTALTDTDSQVSRQPFSAQIVPDDKRLGQAGRPVHRQVIGRSRHRARNNVDVGRVPVGSETERHNALFQEASRPLIAYQAQR